MNYEERYAQLSIKLAKLQAEMREMRIQQALRAGRQGLLDAHQLKAAEKAREEMRRVYRTYAVIDDLLEIAEI